MNINIEKVAIVLKFAGDGVKSLISSLSTFIWLFVAFFAMTNLLPTMGLEATVERMQEYVVPILMNWEMFFWMIFLTAVFYNVFQYKKEWKEAKLKNDNA